MLYQRILSNFLQNDNETLFYNDGGRKYTWKDSSFYVCYLINKYLIDVKNKEKEIYLTSSKSFETYCLILACYLIGLSYTPIDFRDKKRLMEIDDDSLIFSSTKINDISFIRLDLKESNLNDLVNKNTIENIQNYYEFNSRNIVYKMTSSGTTGEPKVIPINSINLENYISQINKLSIFKSGDVFSQVPNLTFDLSVHDIFLSFFHKGTLVPISSDLSPLFTRFVKNIHINHIMAVPSFLDIALRNNTSPLKNVFNIFLCGEALRSDVAKRIRKGFPNAKCFNLYGPTECTIAVLFHDFSDEEIDLSLDQIPIGKPFHFNHAALSKNGELYISGKQVFDGYLTKNPSPFFENKGRKFYKTGDLCKLIESGYYFLGRIGSQIKFRGYRVEIEGLENYLSNLLKSEVILIPHNEISRSNFKDITIFHTNEILEKMEIIRLLPPHLSSVSVKFIQYIPRSKSFKVDRKKISLEFL